MTALNRIWTANISKGRLRIRNRNEVNEFLSQFEGEEIEVIFRKKTYRRSDCQNRYYWAVVITMIADETGICPETVHEMMKARFNKKSIVVKVKGKKYRDIVSQSTTCLSRAQFEDYLIKVRGWASSFLGLYIPLPNEVHF